MIQFESDREAAAWVQFLCASVMARQYNAGSSEHAEAADRMLGEGKTPNRPVPE